MKRLPIILFSFLVCLAACSKSEDPGKSDGLSGDIHFKAVLDKGEAPGWQKGDDIYVYGYNEQDGAVKVNATISSADGMTAEFYASFQESLSLPAVFYMVYSKDMKGSTPFVHSGTAEIITGASNRKQTVAGGETIEIRSSRQTAGVDITLGGIDPSLKADKLTVEFPSSSKVTGMAEFYLKTGKLAITPDQTTVSFIPREAGNVISLELCPCEIAAKTEIKVTASYGDDRFVGSIVIDSRIILDKGERISFSADMHEGVFYNPVTTFDWPDPTIWTDGTYFYTVATGIGSIFSSRDLVHWNKQTSSVVTGAARDRARQVGSNFWAPDVTKVGDKWMLYVTLYNSASDCGIGAFSSSSPTGPFDWVGVITHSKNTGIQDSIDPEVVYDPETSKLWLFFGSVGKMHRVEMSPDGCSIAPGAAYEHVAGLSYAQDNSRNKVFEGGYLYRHGGYWYLFVSSGNYWDTSYKLKVGRSATLDGEFKDKEGRKMEEGFATVVLSSEDGDNFYGPGHNGDIITDKRGQEYMFYHCHDANRGSGRYMLLQRLFWDSDGWPYFQTGKPAIEEIAPKF